MIRAYDDYENVVDLVEWEKRIRTDAERDFQNADYWNDYLDAIKKQIREETINELVNRLKLEEFSAHGLSIINKCAKELKEQK